MDLEGPYKRGSGVTSGQGSVQKNQDKLRSSVGTTEIAYVNQETRPRVTLAFS